MPPVSNLKAVAARAGVSVATASRALSGHPRVSSQTRARVLAAASEVGYRPNVAARALKHNRSTLVGLVLPDVSSYFYAEVSMQIQQLLGAEGYQVILCLHREDPELEREHLLRLAGYQVAALVHAPTSTRSAHAVYTEAGLPVPYVVEVNRHSDDGTTDAVCCTDYDGIYRLTTTLLEHGHSRIGMVTATPRESTAQERLAGLRAALRDGGVRADPALILEKEYSEAWGRDGMRRLMGAARPPTAVIIPANVLVLGALRAISDLGIVIPTDLSLVTFADFPWHTVHQPPLTSVERPHEAMAYEVCRLIVRHARDGAEPHTPSIRRLPGLLKIRSSVRTLPRADKTPSRRRPNRPETP